MGWHGKKHFLFAIKCLSSSFTCIPTYKLQSVSLSKHLTPNAGAGKKDKKGACINTRTNFEDYGLLEPVGLLRADLHKLPFRRGLEEILDAIVCDPPYGVRAGGRKTAARDYTPRNRETHIAATDPYSLGECLRDLLDCAARLLRTGERAMKFERGVCCIVVCANERGCNALCWRVISQQVSQLC